MADLIIKIAGDISDFKASLNEVNETAVSGGDILSGLAIGAGAAFTALAAAIGVCVDAYAETEQAAKEVNLALQNQGIYSDKLVESYREMAEAQSKLTGIDADAISKGQAQLQNLIGMQQITPQLTQALVDLSVKTGNVSSAAQLLGQWVDGNTRGMKLYNLSINENTDEQGRMSQVIEQVEQKFGGLATSMNTGLGSTKGLHTAFQDLEKQIGSVFASSVTTATGVLTNFFEKAAAWTHQFAPAKNDLEVLDKQIENVTEQVTEFTEKSKMGVPSWMGKDTNQQLSFLQNQLDQLIQKRQKLSEHEFQKSQSGDTGQDPSKLAAAQKANSLLKIQGQERVAAAKDANEAIRSDLEQHNLEVTKLTKDQASVEKQLATEGYGEQRTLLQEKLSSIKDELAEQKAIEVEQTKSLNEEIFSNQKQFNDMSIEETQRFVKKNKAQLLSSIDTEATARQKAALTESKERIKAHNQALQDELKFGKAYADINKFMHSEVLTGTKQAFGDLANLTQSGNQTLKEIGKVASVANITIKTAEAAMNIYSGFAEIPIVGIALGIAGAAAAVAFGAEQIGTVMGAADGGLITGGIPGIDSVPVLAQHGELIAPKQNFDEVVNAVANQRAGVGNGAGGSGGTMGIVISMDGKEAERVLTARSNEAKGLGIYTGGS